MVVDEFGFLLSEMTMKKKKIIAHHSVTVWQNSTEYHCAASADILLQLVAKSDYVLY